MTGTELSRESIAALTAAGLDPADVTIVLRRGLAEDLGTAGDLTSLATIDRASVISVGYVARETGVIAGVPVLRALVDLHVESAELVTRLDDGDRMAPGVVIAELTGNARDILAIERLSLNLLGHLSGVATVTRRWSDAMAGTTARVRDTRKTTPGLRDLDKYAVRCGGGLNHRRGLDDAVLIKDNHVATAGGVGVAIDRVQTAYRDRGLTVQVEVDSLDQLAEALEHGATQILLDNFDVDMLTRAVKAAHEASADVRLEASGGLQLDNARDVAMTGVDYLAVGALTHSAPIIDIGLDAR